jgi:PAS domain S-box-containing protein
MNNSIEKSLPVKPLQSKIIDALPIAIYSCDKDGYVTEYNKAAVELWGREPKKGKQMWCGSWRIYRIDGTLLPLNDCPMAVALKAGRTVTGEEIIVERADGTRRYVEPHPIPFFNEDGTVSGAVNMLIDITERKNNEAKVAYLAAIVENSDDAIVSKTLGGVVTSWNKAAERIFGYTAAEMVGHHITKIIPEDRLVEEDMVLSRLRQGIPIDHFYTRRITKDKRLVDVSLTVSPVKDKHGNIIGASKIARDITAQKEAERLFREGEEKLRMAISIKTDGTLR